MEYPPASTQLRREDLGLSRRELLRLTGLVSGAGLASLPLAACDRTKPRTEPEASSSASSPSAGTDRPVRREITTTEAQKDLASFRTAITKMKQLPSSDGRNWDNQARIHQDHCRHGSWLFFPWHRAYLYYFEQICRELSADATFALPYWNWSANPQIPAVFLETSSPLYFSDRLATASSVADARFVGPQVIGPMLDEPNFLLFAGAATSLNDSSTTGPGYGLVEQTPHNYIHVPFVDGTMGTFMSPLDPIFWAHHNRVDELWMEWNILKDHPNTDDQAWLNTEFTEFCDGKGNQVSISVATTVLMPLLSYRFDTQGTP